MSREWVVPVRVAAALALGFAFAGCAPTARTPTPLATPTAAPIFATDEEALAAATEAYERYLEVSDAILADGGKDPERIAAVVDGLELDQLIGEFNEFASTGNHSVGQSAFDSIVIQEYAADVVSVYLCLDVSAVRIMDASGDDVTPRQRAEISPMNVKFAPNDAGITQFVGSEVWASYTCVTQ